MYNNPYNFNNPYQNYFNPQPQQNNILPAQQIVQVAGKASIDTLQLAPNSSLLAMDTTAPIVWMCVSDGIGKVTSTPYDISVHQDAPPIDMAGIETRLAKVESFISNLEEKINAKSNASAIKSGEYKSGNKSGKGIDE